MDTHTNWRNVMHFHKERISHDILLVMLEKDFSKGVKYLWFDPLYTTKSCHNSSVQKKVVILKC